MNLPVPGEELEIDRQPAFPISPAEPTVDPPTLGHEMKWMFEQLLHRGFAIAGGGHDLNPLWFTSPAMVEFISAKGKP